MTSCFVISRFGITIDLSSVLPIFVCDGKNAQLLDGAYEAGKKETKRRILGSTNQRIICLTDRYKYYIEDWFLQNEKKLVEVNVGLTIIANGDKI